MTGKKSTARTAAQKRLSAQRSAAARGRIATAQRRRNMKVVLASAGAIVAVIAVLVAVKYATDAGKPKSGQSASPATGAVQARIAAVPTSTFDAVKAGSGTSPPTGVDEPPLTSGAKPRMIYIGAEFCPYCAAERWPVAVALSRFGTFRGLGQVTSSPSDVYPSTATLSFHGATFTSRHLAFTGVEVQSNQVAGNTYAALDTPAPADQALWQKHNGGYPFVDIGGKWLIQQVSYSPGLLQGKTHDQIAASLADPTSPIGRAVDGTANLITAAICTRTANKPAAVCTSAGVTAAAAKLPHGG